MKKTLLATTALALVAASASAVDVELYGQVNKGLFGFDDGRNNDVVVVDNNLSSTRFGFKGAQALDNGLTASVLFEGEMASNPSNLFTQNTVANQSATPTSNTPTFDERQARVGLSGGFGGVYLGQQSTAYDGVLEQDLVGVRDVMSSDFSKIGGGLAFRTSAGALSGVTVAGQTDQSYDSRADSIRYDSPIFNGFQGRASIAQGGNMDLSVFYDGAFGDFTTKAAAGVAFVNTNATPAANTNTVEQRYGASASVAHTSGFAGTVGYSTADLTQKSATAEDPDQWYVKAGYSWDAYEVAADWSQAEHFGAPASADDELSSFGLGAQYNLGSGVTAAALYRNFDAERTGASYDSIDLYGVNMRVKF